MTSVASRLAALAGAGVLACAGAAFAASPASASTPAPTERQKACDRAPWEARVQNEPKGFGPGSAGGDYLWHSSTGFHLRVTHAGKNDRRLFSGKIESSAPMRLNPVRTEGRDVVALSANRKVIWFHFYNYGRVDGFDFHTDCARSLTVSHLVEGHHATPPNDVALGYFHAHPKQIPFTVHRYGGPS